VGKKPGAFGRGGETTHDRQRNIMKIRGIEKNQDRRKDISPAKRRRKEQKGE
jgi:hypothetical protein